MCGALNHPRIKGTLESVFLGIFVRKHAILPAANEISVLQVQHGMTMLSQVNRRPKALSGLVIKTTLSRIMIKIWAFQGNGHAPAQNECHHLVVQLGHQLKHIDEPPGLKFK